MNSYFSTFLVIFYSENVVGLSQQDTQLNPAQGGGWAEQAQQPPDVVLYFLLSGLFQSS